MARPGCHDAYGGMMAGTVNPISQFGQRFKWNNDSHDERVACHMQIWLVVLGILLSVLYYQQGTV